MATAPEPTWNSVHTTSSVSATKEQLEDALALWQRISNVSPDDGQAARMVALLAIELDRRRAGLKPCPIAAAALAAPAPDGDSRSESPPDESRSAEGAASAAVPRTLPGAKLTPIQQLEVAIRDQPSHAEWYLMIVPLYLEKEREYDAERLLEKGKEATGDLRVRQLWEDVTMLRMEKKIDFARQEAERSDTPQARAELTQLRAERDRFAIEAFTGRCQREPDNLALRYELGLKLQRAGKLRAACEQFEEALADPVQKPRAAFQLGQCRAQFFEYPQALHCYRLAAGSAGPEDIECRKEALYRAAELAARVKLKSASRHYLEELLEMDPHYRDAAGLLESLPQVVV